MEYSLPLTFVQTTAFNAIFYSVPPKIMAFYNAYIYRLKEILRDKQSEENITYLIYPSFSPEMSTEKISLEDKPPCDRILKVKISEKTLYDMSVVTYQLVHELAHNIGNSVRNRKIRTKLLFHSLLVFILNRLDIKEVVLIESIEEVLEQSWLEKNENIYLEDFYEKSALFLYWLGGDATTDIIGCLRKKYQGNYFFYDKMLMDLGIVEEEQQKQYINFYMEQFCDAKATEFHEKILYMMENYSREYNDVVKLLIGIYYECYADLQMILVLGMTPEEYINMFIEKENIPIKELINDLEDLIRISTIYKVMVDCKIWKNVSFRNKSAEVLRKIISESNQMVFEAGISAEMEALLNEIKTINYKKIKNIVLLKNGKDVDGDMLEKYKCIELSSFSYIMWDLYKYLLYVIKSALKDYIKTEKEDNIREARKVVGKILRTDNMLKVYNCIEEEIDWYRQKIFDV